MKNDDIIAIEDVVGFPEESEPTFWHQKPAIMLGNSNDALVEIKGSNEKIIFTFSLIFILR